MKSINTRRSFLETTAFTFAGLTLPKFSLFDFSPGQSPSAEQMPSLKGANEWINSKALKDADLKGKVVVVNFWTYTCINWLRTLPYLRAWSEKYKDKGLIIIGIHTPEFPFEYDINNVRQMSKEMKIDYPIAIDNDYRVWSAFNNQYWPATYFVDAKGSIRDHQFGEGKYRESEQVIQQLLIEAGNKGITNDLVSVQGKGLEAAADWEHLGSRENYIGFERTENFASAGGMKRGKSNLYTVPMKLDLNEWAVGGYWTMEKQSAVLDKANGQIVTQFRARDLHLVLGPTVKGNSIRFQIKIDGMPPGASHGDDVDEQGYGTVNAQRLYQLVRQPGAIMERTFEIEFLDAGVGAFAFTFG